MRDLAQSDRAAVCRPFGLRFPAVCVQTALGAITKALKTIYTAPTETAARQRFDEFTEDWGDRYPVIVRTWHARQVECLR